MARLESHGFDDAGGRQSFAVKLAAAEGWKAGHAARVVAEYLRFLYLTQVSEPPVTPSVPVDKAWHLHLTFTRDYWDVLCKDVLRADLHHDPAKGSADAARIATQYADTRLLYAQEFGAVAPADIWPLPGSRPARRRARAWALIAAGGCGLAGAAALWGGLTALGITLLVFGVGFVFLWVLTMPAQGGGAHGVAGCGGHAGGAAGGTDSSSAGCGGGGCGGGGG